MTNRGIESVRLLYDNAKQNYEHTHGVTQRLDTKANVVIGLIGVIIGLSLKWVSDIYSNTCFPYNPVGVIVSMFLIIALFMFFLTIYTAIIAYKAREYKAIDPVEAINQYGNLDDIPIMERLARDYAETTSENNYINEQKAKLINKSFDYFMQGLITFSVFMGMLLLLNC